MLKTHFREARCTLVLLRPLEMTFSLAESRTKVQRALPFFFPLRRVLALTALN